MAFLIRGIAVHGSSSCSREDSLGDCGCPCDPLSCLLFSALWLRCSQSALVQETQSAKDFDLTCSTTFLFRDVTCLPVGPMSLDWPVTPFGRSDSSRSSLPPDVPSGVQQRGACPASIRSLWRQARPLASSPFHRLAGRGPSFRGSTLPMGYAICALS